MGTVPAPYTPTAGDDATQARVLTWADAANYLLGNATSGGSKRPVARLRQTVAMSIATSAVSQLITFDTEDVDYDNGHSTSTNTSRYTAATAGWHQVNYGCAFAVNATGQREVFLKINSAFAAATGVLVQASAADITDIAGSQLIFLNVGDFVEVWAYQNSGGALNTFVTSPNGPFMSVEWRSN